MAALVGAPVIKFKPPTKGLEQDAAKAVYEKTGVPRTILAERVRHIMQSSFAGRRIVIFSGGAAQDRDGLLEEIRGLRDGGANGSIIGRNTSSTPVRKLWRCSPRSSASTRTSPDPSLTRRYQSVSAHSRTSASLRR